MTPTDGCAHPNPQACIDERCTLYRCGNPAPSGCIAHWHCRRCGRTRCHDGQWREGLGPPGSSLPRVQAEGTAA
jgi:hypothetical protein